MTPEQFTQLIEAINGVNTQVFAQTIMLVGFILAYFFSRKP